MALIGLVIAPGVPSYAASSKAGKAHVVSKEAGKTIGQKIENKVSLEFNDAPVNVVLQALADHQQLNLVVAPGVEGVLSLRLRDLPWQQAFDIILQMGKLTSKKQGNVLMIFPESELLVQQQQKAERAARQLSEQPLVSKTRALKHADANEVAISLNAQQGALLSTRGQASADSRTNTLLIRDTAKALDDVLSWVDAMDRPLQQVQLVAHIVTINSHSLRELGVRWGFNSSETQASSMVVDHFNMGLPVANPTLTAGFNLARISGRLLDLELTALEQEGNVEIIASPRLLTAHSQTASIKQGTEIPYQVSSGASGSTSIEFKEAVLGMEVTPKILPNGAITLALQISQNMPGRSIRQAEGEALAIDKQEIKTQVTVKNGETIVLGGIFQRHNEKSQSKVPGLGNVPLIGSLFKYQSTEQRRRELVIFITPTLIESQ